MTKINWDGSGQEKARVATGLIADIVANLDPEKDRPLRELLAAYYTELINQRSGSNLSVLRRLYLSVSKCMQQNGIILNAENEQRLAALLALGAVRYPSD
ncbi:bacteriocin immunity protein [Lactiplantibacillus sp. WILCCON 0030]|uniref:Bacteriocin immunity protein n=1 Tax=Lactiplantibacillus brownii TaxID=3069269 RepID=A0ABU1A587_9LACO|nr:bacteriocin immunity protein [Lactiplantibacillus brownii]MDQ7936141.1 bacteriocin immunity protein [Lactiplantibacillus brownii]